jgi:hypothetical protein
MGIPASLLAVVFLLRFSADRLLTRSLGKGSSK